MLLLEKEAPGLPVPEVPRAEVAGFPVLFEETGLSRCSAPNPDRAWLSNKQGVPSQLERRDEAI